MHRLLPLLAVGAAGCAAHAGAIRPAAMTAQEQRLLAGPGADLPVVVRGGPGALVLRRRAREVPPGTDLRRLAQRMEATMRKAQGVGIAGPQVGVSLRVATLMMDYRTDKPWVLFVANPVLMERSDATQEGYEGCLSIPGVGGLVRRNQQLLVRYQTLDGRKHTRRVQGPNAVLWQHELDHLDGILYTDRLLGDLLPMHEVRRRRAAER